MAGLVAVTGATGFLGRRLVQALAADGFGLRALVRRQPDAVALAKIGVEPVLGDLADAKALDRLTAEAETVIHGAGLIKARNRADFFAVNRDGARRVAAASPGRIILISSLAAREPALSDYAASKRAGEEAMREAAPGRLTILRPPAIYGPGDRETLALFKLAGQAPALPLPGGPEARLAVAHVDDVVATIRFLIDRPPLGGPFAVGGDKPSGYGWRTIFTAAAAAMGHRPRLIRLPPGLIRMAGALSQHLGAFAATPPIFTPGKARELLHPDWSVGPAELAPGAPGARFSLDAGFADTVAWYREQRWL